MARENSLLSPALQVRGVGPRRASLLARLGITSVKDTLYYLPFRYEDRRSLRKIAHLGAGELTTVSGRVVRTGIVPLRKRKLTIFEAVVSDGSGYLRATWFNQPYLSTALRPGQEVILHGNVRPAFRAGGKPLHGPSSLEIVSPDYEIVDERDDEAAHLHTGRIVPIYRTTEGLSQKQLRNITSSALEGWLSAVRDPLPPEIKKAHHLPDLQESLSNVHFPAEATSLEVLNRGTSAYHQRLAFEELFFLELGLAVLKRRSVMEEGLSFSPEGRLIDTLLKSLPFRLTLAQQRVLGEILRDMGSPRPMHRLLQGDVGSGKTVVAILTMLAAVECGFQAALMAPTEILAEQHVMTLRELLTDLPVKVILLTGSQKGAAPDSLASGEADIVVGTHALIQEKVSFRKLGLIVIDEQHRFGVIQRAALRKKGKNPDTLIMTATPIPRTLALTLYGDLDYCLIDELPPERSPVITLHVDEGQKQRVYACIEEEMKKGRQVYVVYPVIEESEKTDLKAAITGRERLQKKFPANRVGLIHGRMKHPEREEVMKEFKRGDIGILVATTVIEVGVDVPNATVMVIIHAERFGLAQLHQLRGRVGRGGSQSYCLLLSYHPTEDARRRLDALVGTTDGFRIAEEDLMIRGSGEFFGTRQSGLPDLKAANLLRDVKLLEGARGEAFSLIERDPALDRYPHLRRALEDFWGNRIEIFKTA